MANLHSFSPNVRLTLGAEEIKDGYMRAVTESPNELACGNLNSGPPPFGPHGTEVALNLVNGSSPSACEWGTVGGVVFLLGSEPEDMVSTKA